MCEWNCDFKLCSTIDRSNCDFKAYVHSENLCTEQEFLACQTFECLILSCYEGAVYSSSRMMLGERNIVTDDDGNSIILGASSMI